MQWLLHSEIERVENAADVQLLVDKLGVQMHPINERELRGRCPLHDNATNPSSFSFRLDTKTYRCYSCGETGNVLQFVRKVLKAGFREAVNYVATTCGIRLRTDDITDAEFEILMQQEKRNQRQREVDKFLAKGRQQVLPETEELPEVSPLDGEFSDELPIDLGLAPETLKEFGVRYCIKDFNRGKFKDGKWLYPRGYFTGRIVIPISIPVFGQDGNVVGDRLVGFTGRMTEEWQKPKYLNNVCFPKEQVPFGYDKAIKDLVGTGVAIVVEGPKDVMGLWQIGVRNAVAALGSEFLPGQASQVYKYVGAFWLAFDGDEAGDKGAVKTAEELKRYGIRQIYRIPLPPGRDPDELTRAEWDDCVSKRFRL